VYPTFKPKANVRDTLVMSRLVYPDMKEADFKHEKRLLKKGKEWIAKKLFGRHSLESWGQRLGEWKGEFSDMMKAKGKTLGLKGKELDAYVWASWSQEMQDYCVQDVVVTELIWNKLCDKLREWELDPLDFNPPPGKDAIQLEHLVEPILFRQQQYGFKFNEQKAAKLYSKLVARRTELETDLQDVFRPWFRKRERVVPKQSRSVKRSDMDWPHVTVRRYSEKTGREIKPYVGPVREHYEAGAAYTKVSLEPFNPGSRDDIADRLIKLRGWKPVEFTNDGKPTVNDEVLQSLPFPEAKLLAEYFMVQKRIGQLAEGSKAWMKTVKEDGAVHGSVVGNGAVTGRMTHKDPNMAQVPGVYDKKTGDLLPYGRDCRELFEARPGRVIVGCDADALELRCLGGYMSRYDGGDYIKTILEGRKEDGTDMHTRNAKALGIGRDAAKTWFYAFIYGAWYFTLGVNAGATGSREDIIAVGKRTSDSFLKNLPALNKLINAVKKKAKGQGWIRGLDGRRIPIRSEHSCLNTLLQSAGAIFMKRALVFLDASLQQEKGLVPYGEDYEFVANVHDEWQIETKETHAETVGAVAKWAIEKAGVFYNFGCPLSGSSAVGANWAETH